MWVVYDQAEEFKSIHKEVHKIQLSIELTKCQIYFAIDSVMMVMEICSVANEFNRLLLPNGHQWMF